MLLSLVLFCGFVFLILVNLSENISFFYTPTELVSSQIAEDREIRIGGNVKNIRKNPEYTTFTIYDDKSEVDVTYNGLAPKLMQEGIEIIVCGKLHSEKFDATQVLIKHDERYYPRDASAKDS